MGLWPDVRVAPWGVARVLVGVAYVVAIVVADELTPGDRPYHLRQGLFAWDGTFYRDITNSGYGGVEEEALRFFPLVPLLARAVAVPLLGARELALVLVRTAPRWSPGCCSCAWPAGRRGTTGWPSGRSGSWPCCRRPSSWSSATPSPSCWPSLSAPSSPCADSGGGSQPPSAWRPGCAARSVWRSCSPAAVEAARGLAGLPWREWVARAAAVLAPVVGLASYLAWVGAEFGDWRLPMRLQETEELRGGYANPVTRAWESISGLFGDERFGDGLHAPWILLYLALVVVLLWRWPLAYGLYAGAMLVVALAAEDIGSFERYGLSAFPSSSAPPG